MAKKEPVVTVEKEALTENEIFEITRLLDQILQMNSIGRWPLPAEQWNAIQSFKRVNRGEDQS